MSFAYLGALALSVCGMVALDWRWRLTFFRRFRFSAIAVGGMLVFFLLWDAAGIAGGVFLRGHGAFMTGVLVAPELPLEEPVFLAFLAYLTLNVVGALQRWRSSGGEVP